MVITKKMASDMAHNGHQNNCVLAAMAPKKRHFHYETTGNGLTVDILDQDGESAAFMQGDDAASFLAEIERIETGDFSNSVFTADDAAQYLMSSHAQ